MNKLFYTVCTVLVGLIVGTIIGYSLHADAPAIQVGTSAAGSTFDTAKQASITVDMSAVATSSSILNSSTNDRFVTGVKIGCESVGTSQSYVTGSAIAKLTLTVATTSTASPVTTRSNTNVVGVVDLATSTPNFVTASSTTALAASASAVNNIWLAGSYMTFYTNATNTAQCTFGVDYFSS